MHIIREREECITRTRHPIQLPRPLPSLALTQTLNLVLKQTFPLCLLSTFQCFTPNEEINRVGYLCALHTLFER